MGERSMIHEQDRDVMHDVLNHLAERASEGKWGVVSDTLEMIQAGDLDMALDLVWEEPVPQAPEADEEPADEYAVILQFGTGNNVFGPFPDRPTAMAWIDLVEDEGEIELTGDSLITTLQHPGYEVADEAE